MPDDFLSEFIKVQTGSNIRPLLDRMRRATSGQESGGNTRAINPRTKAGGEFQVIPQNVGPWTKKYLKRQLTPEQFLADPEAQRQVFEGEMGSYLQKAKARGVDDDTAIRMAAAAWYGGEGAMNRYDDDWRPRPNEPSFREYTNSVLKRARVQQPAGDFTSDFIKRQVSQPAATNEDFTSAFIKEQVGRTPSPTNPVQTAPINKADLVVPEAPATLAVQLRSTVDGNSPKAAVLVNANQVNLLEPALLKALKPVQLPDGRVLFVNEQKARNLGVTDYARDFAKLIGKVEDVGDNTGTGQAIVTLGGTGEELNSSIVTSPQAAAKQAALDRAMFPNAAKQEILPAQEAVQRRVNTITLEQAIGQLEQVGQAASKGEMYVPEGQDPQVYQDYIRFAQQNGLDYKDRATIDAFNVTRQAEAEAAADEQFRGQKGYDELLRFAQEKGLDEKDPATIEAFNKRPRQQAPQTRTIRENRTVQRQGAGSQVQESRVSGPATDDLTGIYKTVTVDPKWSDERKLRTVLKGELTGDEINNLITRLRAEGKPLIQTGSNRDRTKIGISRQNIADARAMATGDVLQDAMSQVRAEARTIGDQRMEQAQNYRSPAVSRSNPTSLPEAAAERELDKRIQEPGYSAQDRLKRVLLEPWNLMGPTPAAWLARDVDPVKEKERLRNQYGSYSKAWDAEQEYQNEPGVVTAVRAVNQTARSFAKNLVAGTAKSVAFLDKLNEDLNPLMRVIPEESRPTVRNAANVADFLVRLISAPDAATAYREWERNTDKDDLINTHVFKAANEFEQAVGDDKVLKGRFLGELANASGSALSFIALGATMPSMRLVQGGRDWATAVSGALQMAGPGYEEGRKEGLSEADAKKYGVFQGLLGMTEMLGAGNELAALIKNPTIRGKLATGILEVAKSSGREMKQEFGQEVFQTVAGKSALEALKDEDPSAYQKVVNLLNRLPEQIATAMSNEGLYGAITGGVTGGATQVAKEAINPRVVDNKGREYTVVEDQGEKLKVQDEKGNISVRNADRLTPINETKVQESPASVDAEPVVSAEAVEVSRKPKNVDTKPADVDAVNTSGRITDFSSKWTGEIPAPKNIETVEAGKARVKELETEVAEERRKGTTDRLTGLANQNAWEAAKDRIEADPEQEVISFDVNRLKVANDTTDHEAVNKQVFAPIGKKIAEVLEKNGIDVRNGFRSGGDEFTVAVPKGQAEKVRDEIEKAVGAIELTAGKDYVNERTGETFKKGDVVPVTLSGSFGQTVADAEVGLDERKKASKAANPVRRVEAAKKEPWEMTRSEYFDYYKGDDGFAANGWDDADPRWNTYQEAKRLARTQASDITPRLDAAKNPMERGSIYHRSIIENALSEGKPVPAEVLADYPDLAPKKEAKKPWEAAREAIQPYVENLKNLSDKELKAEAKKTADDVNKWARDTPNFVGDRVNPELGKQAGFEITEKMHAVDREIEARKKDQTEPKKSAKQRLAEKGETREKDDFDKTLDKLRKGNFKTVSAKDINALSDKFGIRVLYGGLTRTGEVERIEIMADDVFDAINRLAPDRLTEAERTASNQRLQDKADDRAFQATHRSKIYRDYYKEFGENPTRFIKVDRIKGNPKLFVEISPNNERGKYTEIDTPNHADVVKRLRELALRDKETLNPRSVEILQNDVGSIIDGDARYVYKLPEDAPKPKSPARERFEKKKAESQPIDFKARIIGETVTFRKALGMSKKPIDRTGKVVGTEVDSEGRILYDVRWDDKGSQRSTLVRAEDITSPKPTDAKPQEVYRTRLDKSQAKIARNKSVAKKMREKGYEYEMTAPGVVKVTKYPDSPGQFEIDLANSEAERKASSKKGKPVANPKTQSLSTYLLRRGGIQPNSVIDLEPIKLSKLGKFFISSNGQDVEDAFRDAVEAGYFPGLINQRAGQYDMSIDEFVNAVADDANGFKKLYTSEALEAVVDNWEQQAKEYGEQQEEMVRQQEETVTKLVDLLEKDSQFAELLATIEQNDDYLEAHDFGVDLANTDEIRKLKQILVKNGISADLTRDFIEAFRGQKTAQESDAETDRVLSGRDESVSEANEPTFGDALEPEGEVDTSFDPAEFEEAPKPKPATAFDQVDLFGNKLTPKTEAQSLFEMGEGETVSPDAEIAKVQKTIDGFASRAGNEALVKTANEALKVFALARKTRASVADMLRQQNLDGTTVADELSPQATKLLKAMDAGTFDAAMATESMRSPQEAQDEPKSARARLAEKAETAAVEKPAATTNIQSDDEFRTFAKAVRDGDITSADQIRTAFKAVQDNREAITTSLQKLTIADLKKRYNSYHAQTKADWVKTGYHSMLQWFALGKPISYGFSSDPAKAYSAAVQKIVDDMTDADVKAFADEMAKALADRKERIQGFKKSLENPETLEEFENFFKYAEDKKLTPEQVRRYDALFADKTLSERKEKKAKSEIVEQVDLGDSELTITKSYHTKHEKDVWIVSVSEKVSRDQFDELNNKAKQLGGRYRPAWKPTNTPAGFQFFTEAAAQKFAGLQEGDVDRSKELAERAAFRQMNALERLRVSAAKLRESAEAELAKDRKVNTARRARMAANVERRARVDLSVAQDMENVADAIEQGKTKYLNEMWAQTHFNALERLLQRGVSATENARLEKAREEGTRYEADFGRVPTQEDIDNIKYPYPITFEHDKATLEKVGQNVDGVKLLARGLAKHHKFGKPINSAKNLERLRELVKRLKYSKASDGQTLWYRFNSSVEEINRLNSIGLANSSILREALREYLPLRNEVEEESEIKKLERELVGTNYGRESDYFPTPPDLARRVAETADIRSGMTVLEPSAGKGNLLDAIAEAQPEAEIEAVEMLDKLRKLVELKGYNLVGHDFMDFEPGKQYDRIVMNPPFKDEQEHIRKAYDLLAPGGRLVAITSPSWTFNKNKKAEAFREWVDDNGGYAEELPEGSFARGEVSTGVATRLLVMDKPEASLQKVAEEGDKEYLTKLKGAHYEDLTTRAESKFTDGNLELNEEAGELMRRLEDTGAFYGATYSQANLKKLAKKADEWIERSKELGYTDRQIKGLTQLAENLKELAKQKVGIGYVFDEALPEETHHKMVLELLDGKKFKDYSKFKELSVWNDPLIKRLYPRASNFVRTVEIAAKLETGQIESADKEKFLNLFADAIIDTVGPEAISDPQLYTRILDYASAKTSDTGRGEESGGSRSVEEPGSETSEGTRDRDPGTEGVRDTAAEEPGEPAKPRNERERKVASFSRILGQEYFYDPQSHDETEVRAAQLISDKGTQQAIHDALYGTPSAEGMRVVYWELERLTGALDNAIAEDNKAEIAAYSEAAADLSAKIVQRQVAGGQETEIAKMLVPLSPESALLTAQKMVEYAKGEGSTLTPDQTETVIRLAQELKDARADIAKQDKKVKTLEKRIDKLKEDRPQTKTAKMLRQYRKRKPVLIKELQDLFPEASVFNGETNALQMVAWHGSPHRFAPEEGHPQGRFRTDKIGTGEGAQAYGYGLYFAGNEDVADFYKNKLSTRVVTYKGDYPFVATSKMSQPQQDAFNVLKMVYHNYPKVSDAANAINIAKNKLNEDIEYFRSQQRKSPDDPQINYLYTTEYKEAALKALDTFDPKDIRLEGGAKYRVELKPAEDEYLLWDKPLSEQSEKVKKALEAFFADEQFVEDMEFSGIAVNTAQSADDDSVKGGEFYKDLARTWSDDAEASEYLRFLGIRGIKYLDGSSRGKGEGNYNYVIFDDQDVEILDTFQMAASGLTDQQYAKLVEYASGEILENKPYKTLMSELDEFTGDRELSKEVHAEAVDSLRSERGTMSDEAKSALKTRNEHYREADKILKPKAPKEQKGFDPKIKINDETVKEFSRIGQRVWAKTKDPLMTLAVERLNTDPKTINEVIKDIQKANPGMSLSDATKFARDARKMLTETKAEIQAESDKLKGILPEQRRELQAAKVAKQKATMKLNKFLANLADDSNAIKRFNNDMRAKFVSNWGTQAFNAIQALPTNTAEAMLDLFTATMKATGLNIGETPDINAKDVLLPFSYVFANNRQMAEFALAEFPEQFFAVHSGLLGDIDIEPVNLADNKKGIAKGIHKWFDANQRLNNVLAKITGAKLQEMHFRNAMVAGTFDQIIRRKSGGKATLESAIDDGTVKNYITEEDAEFAAKKALRVTYAALIDDKIGKTLKRVYDKMDSFVPIFLNPVTYARFTYTTTKVMVANPILFGLLDSKAVGGPGYTTRSLASGMLGWAGIAMAYGLMANFGGDDDEWYTLKFGDTYFDIRRAFPLSSYFYMAHLIKNLKDGKPAPSPTELLEGFASLETDYFTYGAGLELKDSLVGAYSGTKNASDVGASSARLMGNFFAGYLRFFKPMKDVLAQFDEEENKLRFYNNSSADKFVKEISMTLPFVAQAYNAEKQKDARGNEIGMPFPAGRPLGIKIVHPSFLTPQRSTATKWAQKLFKFEGSGGEWSAEDRKAYQARKVIKNAIRRGVPKAEVQGQLQAYKKEFGEKSFGRLQDELTMSEMAAQVKYNFGVNDKRDVESLRKVWKYATDAEKAELRRILRAKRDRTTAFDREFGL